MYGILDRDIRSVNRHNVFVSYHHKNDEAYKVKFEQLFSVVYDILETKSVTDGDIDPCLKTAIIRQKIRDDFIKTASVTIVLIGSETWKRKHVDWEISSSIRKTKLNSRTGLLGILLPTHPDYGKNKYNPYICPPRLHQNVENGFAKLYSWNKNPNVVQSWIHEAFKRRNKINPNNAYPSFAKNRSGNKWQ